MEIANIHAMRQSHDQLVEHCQRGSEHNWLSGLENTGWLGHLRGLLSAAQYVPIWG